jgi:hypothetical protein
LVDSLLAGYQSVAPLPDGWHEFGGVFELAAQMFLAHYLAGRAGSGRADHIDAVRRLVAGVSGALAAEA